MFLLQLVGGVDQVQQSIALGKRPHIVVSLCFTALLSFVMYRFKKAE